MTLKPSNGRVVESSFFCFILGFIEMAAGLGFNDLDLKGCCLGAVNP